MPIKCNFNGTLTLHFSYLDGWDDFLADSGIPNTEKNKEIFCYLYNMFGDAYTLWNAKDILDQKLAFIINEASKKYAKIE
jgi:hypothetical protein